MGHRRLVSSPSGLIFVWALGACTSLDGLSGGSSGTPDASSSSRGDSALEVGTSMNDASVADRIVRLDAPVDAPGSMDAGGAADATSDAGRVDPNIRCMADAAPSLDGGVDCIPSAQECCVNQTSSFIVAFCVVAGNCSGSQTDVLCDKPSQCTNQRCLLCLDTSNNLQGSSCSVSDIDEFGCDAATALTVCAPHGVCEAGTCGPTGVVGFPMDWFWTCQ